MRMIRCEFLKVFGRNAFIVSLLFFLGANALLMQTGDTNASYDKKDYRRVLSTMDAMTSEEQILFAEESYKELQRLYEERTNPLRKSDGSAEIEDEELFAWHELFEALNQEMQSLKNYPNYLKEIKEKASKGETISIFQTQDAFSMRNARKTAKAYDGLETIHLELNNSKMINQTLDFEPTNILIILLIFMVCSVLVVEEKEKGLFSLLRPLKHGRSRLIGAKISALFVITAIICLAFIGENFLISGLQYGFARLSLPLQTIAGYSGSALHMTLGQYLLLYAFSKIIAVFILGLCFFLLALSTKSIPLYYFKVIIFLGLSYFFYAFIPGNSVFQLLKYVNAVQFMRVTPIYQYYFNLNLAGFPIAMSTVFGVTSMVCMIAIAATLVILFSKTDITKFTRKQRSNQGLEKRRVHTSIFYHECYKIFITNRVWIIFLIFSGFQLYSLARQTMYISFDEYYYKQYMTALEGPLDERSIALIEKEAKRYEDLDKLLEDANEKLNSGEITTRELLETQGLIQEQTKGRNAFDRILTRRDYMIQYQNMHNEKLAFVYESGWDYLFGREYTPYQNDMMRAIVLLLVMIAAFSGVFSIEFSTQMLKMILCYKRGRMHTAKVKILICIGITTMLFLINYLPDMIQASRTYGLSGWASSIYSIPSLADFPIDMSVGGYLFLLFAERYLMALCTLCIIFTFSLYAKNMIGTTLPLMFLLVVPLLVDLLGIDIVRNVSWNIFFTGNGYLDNIQKNPLYAFVITIPIFIGLAGIMKIKKIFQE